MDRTYLDAEARFPAVELPAPESLEVRRPRLAISERNVDAAEQNLRAQFGVEAVTEDLLTELGFGSIAELRAELRGMLMSRVKVGLWRSMRKEARRQLLDVARAELPAGLVERFAEFADLRIALKRRLRENTQEEMGLEAEAEADAVGLEVREYVVLRALASSCGADATEAELDARVESLAQDAGLEPDELLAEMSSDGTLAALAVMIREENALDVAMERARMIDVDVKAAPDPSQD